MDLTMLSIVGGIFVFIFIICLFAWYRIVPNGFAHVVVTPRRKMVISPDDKVLAACKENNPDIITKRTYYAVSTVSSF